MTGHARNHGRTPRRLQLDGRDALQLDRAARVDERDQLRCGLCTQPSSTPVCRRCAPALNGERPPRKARP